MVEADRIALGEAASEGEHKFQAEGDAARFDIDSTFEGQEPGIALRACGRRLSRPCEFTARVPRENAGLVLRVLFDAAEGNSEVEILADGKHAASWFRAGVNPHRRLREEDVVIPAPLTAGKAEVRFTVRPVGGAIADCEYRVFAIERR